jgi:hypothetical protein
MILPRLRFAGGRHRCHNSGGSNIAMQGIQKPGFGYQVPLAQKESTPGISRKMMHMCAGRDITGLETKAAGIVGDAGGFSLGSGRGANRTIRYPR